MVCGVWFYVTKQVPQKPLKPAPTNAVAESPQQQPKTNALEISSNATLVESALQMSNAIESTALLTNALTATNLEQWKTAINGFKKLAGFTLDQHWLVEQPGRKTGLPIILRVGDKAVLYNAVLISVNAKNGTGQIIRIEMQTLNMNIDETRELGVQLCDMLGVDSKDFLTWCDKVENHWMDQPLYATGEGNYGFQILNTFDNGKPWMINFVTISR